MLNHISYFGLNSITYVILCVFKRSNHYVFQLKIGCLPSINVEVNNWLYVCVKDGFQALDVAIRICTYTYSIRSTYVHRSFHWYSNLSSDDDLNPKMNTCATFSFQPFIIITTGKTKAKRWQNTERLHCTCTMQEKIRQLNGHI